jgi:hypothetical protein
MKSCQTHILLQKASIPRRNKGNHSATEVKFLTPLQVTCNGQVKLFRQRTLNTRRRCLSDKHLIYPCETFSQIPYYGGGGGGGGGGRGRAPAAA